jgi:hypothetical protein
MSLPQLSFRKKQPRTTQSQLMREHPIPQDITNYRFHIVGSMTLKQFAEVGIGVGVAIILYNTNLFDIIKWPLILLSFGLGAMAAFVPIEERPLDHWIFTFFRILYKPTQFFWKREARIPDVFTFTPSLNPNDAGPQLDLSPARRERIKEFLVTLKTPLSVDASGLDLTEKQHIDSVLNMFQTEHAVPQARKKSVVKKPTLDVRVRNLGAAQLHNIPAQAPQAQAQPTPAQEVVEYHAHKAQLATDQVAQGIAIPELETIDAGSAQTLEENETADHHNLSHENRAFMQLNVQAEHDLTSTAAAASNRELPFPSKPTEPNKLVGMVLTPKDELIESAIVEIQTPEGQIVRAVKTNALGQFFVTTPLKKGQYVLITEKDGFTFPPLNLTLKNSVVEPLEIRGTEVVETAEAIPLASATEISAAVPQVT